MGKLYTRTCKQCGQVYQGQGVDFCSYACRTRHRNLTANPAKTPEARKKISEAKKGKATTTGRKCSQATKAKISKAIKGRKLTEEHKQKIGEGQKGKRKSKPPPVRTGPAHHNWKGGHSLYRGKDFKNPRYIAFREAVRNRAGYKCEECGRGFTRSKKFQLQVHHIKPWGPYPELRYEPHNGILLCLPCHKSKHRGVPKPKVVGPKTVAEYLGLTTKKRSETQLRLF